MNIAGLHMPSAHAAFWNAFYLSRPHMNVTTQGASHRGIVQLEHHLAKSLLIYRSSQTPL